MPTSADTMAELVSYLSGNLADYRLASSASGEIVVTAINSYNERRQTNAELKEVVKEQRKLEKDSLRRAHVYTKI